MIDDAFFDPSDYGSMLSSDGVWTIEGWFLEFDALLGVSYASTDSSVKATYLKSNDSTADPDVENFKNQSWLGFALITDFSGGYFIGSKDQDWSWAFKLGYAVNQSFYMNAIALGDNSDHFGTLLYNHGPKAELAVAF